MTDAIPHAVLSDQVEQQLGGRRLIAALFLTFEFDPGFFEQEVLPVLLDVPLSHARGIRLVQLEDALRACAGRVAVYYDANHLVQGDAGSARLDVRRIPVRHSTGVFHPKNILLLVEESEADEDGHHPQALLVGAMSANMTRSGWWENVEACHLEEIREDKATRMKEDLLDLLRKLRSRTPTAAPHEALEAILKFLRGTEQRVKRFSYDTLLTHFYTGSESFPDFLDRCTGGCLHGAYLEIISPYLDDAKKSRPLEELLNRFQPKEVRLLLPRDRDGTACCSKEMFKSIGGLFGVSWGKLPPQMLRRGKSEDATKRFVHAKVYRFFTQKPKREICFVGSVNLTSPAHQEGGNWETGMLVEVDCPRAPVFWLELETVHPSCFKQCDEADPANAGGTPLMLRYHWNLQFAEAFWEAEGTSPMLRLEARGVALGEVGPFKPRRWIRLNDIFARHLAELLKETSFVEVHGHGDRPGLLLVQEEGMSHKPSLLLRLSVTDILRYWSMLTPEQRSAFIEANTLEIGCNQDGADLLATVKIDLQQQTFFDRFAGFFHAFSCLGREVREQLATGREREADYRLFGRKYDSLGTLLDRVFADNLSGDDIERYVILLCARQLLNDLGRDFSEYWRARRKDVHAIEITLERTNEIRARLAAMDAQNMPAFLDWFDPWFLKRAKPLEEQP